MADINSVVMVGRLVRDSELKYLQNGQAILRFSIAVNRARRNSDGSWTDEANFFDCVYFGKAAEGVSQYLVKGRQVAIQGELRQSRWEADGQTRSRVEISVNNLELCQGQNQQSSGSFAPSQNSSAHASKDASSYSRAPQASVPPVGGPEDFQDDSIPF